MKRTTLIFAIVALVATTASSKHLQTSYLKEQSTTLRNNAIPYNTTFVSGYELNKALKQKLFPKSTLFILLTQKNKTTIITIYSAHTCSTRATKRCIGTYLYGTDTDGTKWTINTQGPF
ncbi:MAG: hypothetical protein OCD01_17170 [Fibrobacterales bacterium]